MTSKFAELLQKVVKDEHVEKIMDSAGAAVGQVLLREPDANMTINVTNVPVLSAIIRIGGLQHWGGIENGSWKQICDYLLVIPNGRTSWVVLIEMKKTLSDANRDKAEEQLRRSIPVVRYLESLCEIEAKESMRLLGLHHVVLAERSRGFVKDRIRVIPGVKSHEAGIKTIVGRSSVAVQELIDG